MALTLLLFPPGGADSQSQSADGPADPEAGPGATSSPGKTEASPSEIEAWADQLDADQFSDREEATSKLSSAGPLAAAAVSRAAVDGSIEVGLRAIRILNALYRSQNGETVDSAELALLALKSAQHAGVARRAAETLRRHYPIRQERAVAELRELGCQIQFDRFFGRNRAQGLPQHGAVQAVAIGSDWTGGDKGLAQVARLDSLRTIYFLNGHGLGEKAIAGLQKSLPQITVQRRGEAFLGVGTDNDALGCLIQQVTVNSAAARAGLRDFDVVIAFGDRPVLGANDLIDAIAVHKPGDTVKAVVLRDYDRGFQMKRMLVEMLHDEDEFQPLVALGLMANMRVELEITLGRWDLNN